MSAEIQNNERVSEFTDPPSLNSDTRMWIQRRLWITSSAEPDIEKTTCNLSLYHFNARSLNKHANDITIHLATLKCHFNIYGFTETWFRDNNDSNLVDFEGYSAVNCNRKGRSGGGATLFIDNDIEFTIREDLSIKCDDCDSIFIKFNRKERALTRKIIIGVIYRPDYVGLDTFYSDLARVFDVVNNEHKTCYIMGDFNIDLLKFSSNNKISNFVNLIYSNIFSHALIDLQG